MEFRAGGYRGEAEASREVAGFHLTESRYSERTAMNRHSHPLPFLHVILAGAVRDVSNLSASEFHVGELVFHPAESPHTTTWMKSGTGFAVELGQARVAEWSALDLLPNEPVLLSPGFISGLAFALRREAYQSDTAADLTVEHLVLEIMAELARLPKGRAERGAPRWLQKARASVCDTYADPLSLEEIATEANVHPVHLARAFRQHFGETVGDCVRRRRIEAACRQIASTSATLTSVAYDAGFADQSHFVRTFKKQIGMTPSEYATRTR